MGRPVRVCMTKWGDRPHWEFDGVHLGADEHGEWIGFPTGTHHARPGLAFDSAVDSVTLVPTDGWWLATLHAPGIWADTYIDLATPAVWDGDVLRSIDLDLDVIRRSDGTVYLDDEDDFLAHRELYGYPDDVVRAAETNAAMLLDAVRQRRAPFDGVTASAWLARLADLHGGLDGGLDGGLGGGLGRD